MSTLQKRVAIGNLIIGSGFPVRVESMLKTPITDVEVCRKEIDSLAEEGCELLRVAFPNINCLPYLRDILQFSKVPIMADIHFDFKLALAALETGCMAIRINPGNMPKEGLVDIVNLARERKAVIRIGSNSGSLSNVQMRQSYGNKAKALFLAVKEQLQMLEDMGFEDIILSCKSTSITETVNANLLLSKHFPKYPLHIGITEAGVMPDGLVKSAAGMALLLTQGLGDTMRISLSAPAVEEVKAGYALLRSLGLRKKGVEIISCPTCGRKHLDVAKIVEDISPLLKGLPDGLVVAVMGCEVNGPREAKEADVGIAGTPNGIVIFKKGKVVEQIDKDDFSIEKVSAIIRELL
jgi:(E)-4-hydroxy-3-methylbut-2-enyl-diphosphate synthase